MWLTVAAVALLAAAALDPARVLPPLDSRAEEYRDALITGLTVVRLALVAAAVLAASTGRWWPAEPIPAGPPAAVRVTWVDGLLALVVLGVGAALTAPLLGASLWWDELATLTVVRRGPAVILGFSANGNNHVLNSLLLWLTVKTSGEHEVLLHLTPFLFGLLAGQAAFWGLRAACGRGPAAAAGLVLATHPWLAEHATEARGYAGALLFSLLACLLFADLLRGGGRRPALLYVACAVTAIGFIQTTALIVAAHGVAALCWRAGGVSALSGGIKGLTPPARRALFACAWAGILAAILFGVPAVQTLRFAGGEAAAHHRPLGLPLLSDIAAYAAGSAAPTAAVALLALAAWGWVRGGPGRAFVVAFLAPVVAAAAYALLPGARLSPRLLYFLILPQSLGLALALARLARGGPTARLGLVAAAGLWLAVAAEGHWRAFTIGRPDLKALARRLDGPETLLVGPQSDVNAHYFPQSLRGPTAAADPLAPDLLARAEYVIQGRSSPDDQRDPRLTAHGFVLARRLESAVPGRTRYHVYQRDRAAASTPARRID